MGKSDRKVKSDRVNALRKQYDAFLEEDKKRRERNEYILGRLDKMRYSTALVPLRYKPVSLLTGHHGSPAHYQGNISKYSCVREYPVPVVNTNTRLPPIPLKNVDDTILIQEISKKYILIPKLSSFDEYALNASPIQTSNYEPVKDPIFNNVSPSSNENTDWKSKYEILNILKKEEKIEPTPHLFEPNTKKEPVLSDVREQVMNDDDINLKTNKYEETIYKYLDEKPEKDLAPNYHQSGNIDNVRGTEVQSKIVNQVVDSDATTIDNQLQNLNLEGRDIDSTASVINQEAVHEIPLENEPVNEYFKPNNDGNLTVVSDYPINQVESSEYDQRTLDVSEVSNKDIYIGDAEINQIKVTNPSEFNPDTNKEITAPRQDDVEHSEQVNVLESQIKQEISGQPEEYLLQQSEYDSTYQPHAQDEIEKDIEITEEDTTIENNQEAISEAYQEYPVQNDEESGIKDFEAEQAEMFYSEQTGESYQQQDPSTYNQDFSQPDQVYQENSEYTYYEGAQPEAFYEEQPVVGVNENEDVTESYDPHYEQQYAPINVEDGPSAQVTTLPETYETIEKPFSEGYEGTQQEVAPGYVQEGVYENYEQTPEMLGNYDASQTLIPGGYDQIQPGIPDGYDQSQGGNEGEGGYQQHNYETQEQVQQELDAEDRYNVQTSEDPKQLEDQDNQQPVVA